MKSILYTTAAALMVIANPANAQILGGASGGILGGATFPSMPTMPAPMNEPMGPVGSVTKGSVTGTGTATATKSASTRSGKASTNGSATGSASGALSQTLNTPRNSVAANGTGSGSAAGSAGADAQLFGIDAVRGTLRQTHDSVGNTVTTFKNHAGNLVTASRDRAGNLVTTTRDRAGNLLSTTRTGAGSLAGSAQGSAQSSATGSASGSFAGMSQNLALAGSAAADAAGSFDIKPGANLFDLNGEKIGKVREVFADGNGRVKGLLVKVNDTTTLLPVRDFAANGQSLVTALSVAQIMTAGDAQANGSGSGSATGIFAGLSHNLALAGSTAANGAGSFDINSGTQLYDMAGEKIGKVQQVVADVQGRIRALVIKVDDTTATLPAANFAANGDTLVTAMSEGQIEAAGAKQASGNAAGSSRKGASAKGDSGTN